MFLLINHIIHNEPLIAYSLSALKRTAEVMNVNASGKKQQKYFHNIIIHYYDSSSPQWTCMFHTDYIIWKYLIYIWIGSFKSRHFTFYRYSIFFMSLRQALSFGSFLLFFWSAQIHKDGKKRILFAFIILQNHNDLLLLWGHTKESRHFTDLKDVLLLSMAKMEYLSKWLLWTSKLEKFTQKMPMIQPLFYVNTILLRPFLTNFSYQK